MEIIDIEEIEKDLTAQLTELGLVVEREKITAAARAAVEKTAPLFTLMGGFEGARPVIREEAIKILEEAHAIPRKGVPPEFVVSPKMMEKVRALFSESTFPRDDVYCRQFCYSVMNSTTLISFERQFECASNQRGQEALCQPFTALYQMDGAVRRDMQESLKDQEALRIKPYLLYIYFENPESYQPFVGTLDLLKINEPRFTDAVCNSFVAATYPPMLRLLKCYLADETAL